MLAARCSLLATQYRREGPGPSEVRLHARSCFLFRPRGEGLGDCSLFPRLLSFPALYSRIDMPQALSLSNLKPTTCTKYSSYANANANSNSDSNSRFQFQGEEGHETRAMPSDCETVPCLLLFTGIDALAINRSGLKRPTRG